MHLKQTASVLLALASLQATCYIHRDLEYDQGKAACTQETVNGVEHDTRIGAYPRLLLVDVYNALEVMQSHFFELWLGTWPTAIDWTAAVTNTHVSAALSTFSKSLDHIEHMSSIDREQNSQFEDGVNKYFAHNVAFYFAENAFNLRNEAYDDMLWVVLGWLESIKYLKSRNSFDGTKTDNNEPWHGSQFIPAFAHRVRIFYNLASRGWDTSLCQGGMTWNPRLEPYKNAITNQLFISASIAMYLHFPGDANESPYLAAAPGDVNTSIQDLLPAKPHDPAYLKAAVDGYSWLKASNMTNDLGLYVDGFHVKGWSSHNRTGTGRCDARNEMVYTYNQGVVLSGLRELWEATGDIGYLDDGYELIENVMNATGWKNGAALNNTLHNSWAGLGRNGILEELCDHTGQCSQDGQTFKGIFFHHLTLFCKSLPQRAHIAGLTFVASKKLALSHHKSCLAYGRWALHNAEAALRTRDYKGRYGAWWGFENDTQVLHVERPRGAVDYRNNATEMQAARWADDNARNNQQRSHQEFLAEYEKLRAGFVGDESLNVHSLKGREDVNGRGGGRTVETQGGGLAVLRASLELMRDVDE